MSPPLVTVSSSPRPPHWRSRSYAWATPLLNRDYGGPQFNDENALKPFDLNGASELAYDRTSDEATWLAEVTRTSAPAYGVGSEAAVTSYVFDLSEEDVAVGTTSSVGGSSHAS